MPAGLVSPWEGMDGGSPNQLATAARPDENPWEAMVIDPPVGWWTFPPKAKPLSQLGRAPPPPPLVGPPPALLQTLVYKAPEGTKCRERQREYIDAGLAIPLEFTWYHHKPKKAAHLVRMPEEVGVVERERRTHPAGARPQPSKAASPTTLESPDAARPLAWKAPPDHSEAACPTTTQWEVPPNMAEAASPTILESPEAARPSTQEPPTSSGSDDLMYLLRVQGDLLRDSTCDETMSVTSVATSFDTFMSKAMLRALQNEAAGPSTTLQNEVACLREEDEMVCVNTIPGVDFLRPLPASSSFETPLELTVESISIPTPALSPQSDAIPIPFAKATPDAPFLNADGCVPGKDDMPPLQSEGCAPQDSAETPEGPEPDDVAVPPGLSASSGASLALAGLAMVKSPHNHMPKATLQMKYGLRSFTDQDTRWY